MNAGDGARRPPSTVSDPRRLVTEVDQHTLAEALFGGELFGVIDDDLGLRWICPRCEIRTPNGGTALSLDRWRWRCHRCRWVGTRYALEHAVLESAEALGELYRLTEGGRQ